MSVDYSEWGIRAGEEPVAPFWACVVDQRRSATRRFFRGVGQFVLPSVMRNAVLEPEHVFRMAVTNSDMLVIAGLEVTPRRNHLDTVGVVDTGQRRQMRTVVGGTLAGVEMISPDHGTEHFLVPVAALDYLPMTW